MFIVEKHIADGFVQSTDFFFSEETEVQEFVF